MPKVTAKFQSVTLKNHSKKLCIIGKISVKNRIFEGNAVSMGNPHFVIFIKDDEDLLALAKEYGSEIETSAEFPEKTNVEFVEILSKDEIVINVWERGCGITSACGTGACATVVAGILNGYLDNSVKVNLPGGTLKIEWQGKHLPFLIGWSLFYCIRKKRTLQIEWNGSPKDTEHNVYMTGRADYSFIGEVSI